jgi:hypothetical protein
MASWSDLVAAQPTLASAIRALVYQYGPGLGYLATVRRDGGPRVHPVSPVIADGSLYCFIVNSPKRRDLERDGRYALHSYPAEASDDEAYLAGRARPVGDPARVRRLAATMRADIRADWTLFELSIEVAMTVCRPALGAGSSTVSSGTMSTGEGRSERTVWRDPALRMRRVS